MLFAILGFTNALFIPTAVYLLWVQNERFSFSTTPISYARKTHTKNQFITFFIFGTILQAGFIISLFFNFPIVQSNLLFALTAIGLTSSIIIGITTSPRVRRIHQLPAKLFMVAMIVWSLIFHMLIYSVSPIHSILGFVLSVSAIIGVPYFYFYKKSIGWTELFFILIIICWNILFGTLF